MLIPHSGCWFSTCLMKGAWRTTDRALFLRGHCHKMPSVSKGRLTSLSGGRDPFYCCPRSHSGTNKRLINKSSFSQVEMRVWREEKPSPLACTRAALREGGLTKRSVLMTGVPRAGAARWVLGVLSFRVPLGALSSRVPLRGAVFPGSTGGALFLGSSRGTLFPGSSRGAVFPDSAGGALFLGSTPRGGRALAPRHQSRNGGPTPTPAPKFSYFPKASPSHSVTSEVKTSTHQF